MRKEDLALAITDRLYDRHPELQVRYGETGRTKCLQDMRYNLEHLAPAVGLEDPSLFARYVGWLGDLLGARGIPARHVAESLLVAEEVLLARIPTGEAVHVQTAVRAGLAVLDRY